MKKKIFLAFVLMLGVLLTSCNCNGMYLGPNYNNNYDYDDDTVEQNQEIGYFDCEDNPNMYLSLDNSSYSYTSIKSKIENNYSISPSEVKIEELLNYFKYGYDCKTDGLNVKSEVTTCPWNEDHLFQTVCLYAPIVGERLPANLTFLVDVSGSMSGSNRLGLFVDALNECLPNLTKNDRISLVTYASGSKTILDGVNGANSSKIRNAINSLRASGSTNGGAGIKTAYKVAEKNFIEDGINHVFIVTDGDFNVGISRTEELEKFISGYTNKGIYCSVYGVGMGNTRSDMIRTIASNGEGNAYYLSSNDDAITALNTALVGGANCLTKDTKAMVSFNKENVKSYRVIGYETKVLTEEDYNNEEKDAGEIFSGFQVIIAFEIDPNEGYDSNNISSVQIKYKDPKTFENNTVNCNTVDSTSDQIMFASCVVEFGLLLKESYYKENASYTSVINRMEDIKEYLKADDAKLEFLELVNILKYRFE